MFKFNFSSTEMSSTVMGEWVFYENGDSEVNCYFWSSFLKGLCCLSYVVCWDVYQRVGT